MDIKSVLKILANACIRTVRLLGGGVAELWGGGGGKMKGLNEM